VFSKTLVENQKEDGHWECPGEESDKPEYDSYYCTTLSALSLMVYYRYLPTYKTPKNITLGKNKPAGLELEEDTGLEIK